METRRFKSAMVVGVVDPWNHHSTTQIHAFRLRTGQHPDLFRSPNGNNALPPDRQRLYKWMRGIARENLAVQQDQIRRRLVAGRQRRQNGQSQQTEQNPCHYPWHGDLLESESSYSTQYKTVGNAREGTHIVD